MLFYFDAIPSFFRMLGDSAYFSANYLYRPYAFLPNMPYWKRIYNYALVRARVQVEQTIGM